MSGRDKVGTMQSTWQERLGSMGFPETCCGKDSFAKGS